MNCIYHIDSSYKRLEELVKKYKLKGITHYVKDEDDGSWFTSDEGNKLFKEAEKLKIRVNNFNYPIKINYRMISRLIYRARAEWVM